MFLRVKVFSQYLVASTEETLLSCLGEGSSLYILLVVHYLVV